MLKTGDVLRFHRKDFGSLSKIIPEEAWDDIEDAWVTVSYVDSDNIMFEESSWFFPQCTVDLEEIWGGDPDPDPYTSEHSRLLRLSREAIQAQPAFVPEAQLREEAEKKVQEELRVTRAELRNKYLNF